MATILAAQSGDDDLPFCVPSLYLSVRENELCYIARDLQDFKGLGAKCNAIATLCR